MQKLEALLDTLTLYGKYFELISKSKHQYRFDMLLVSLAVFSRESVGIIVVYLTLSRFDNISGWNINELFFLFSQIFLSYGIMIFFIAGLRDFSDIIYEGEFDRYLLRPQGVLFQVLATRTDVFTCIGHGTLGILLFFISANSVGIQWNIQNIIYYAIVLAGSILIQVSIFLISSCFCFWTVKADNIRELLFFSTRKFVGYPISIYPGFIQKLLIFVIPFAFVNYFPTQYFLRKSDMGAYWEGFLYLTPVIGIVMFIFSYMFWRFSIKNYSSTGS